MSQIRKLIAGNWKMNCSRSEAIQLASAVVADSQPAENKEILLCVPSIHLADIAKIVLNTHVKLGAQDAYWQDAGAFTGEVSIKMLQDYQVDYLLVGHSERRALFGDDNRRVAKKFAAAIEYGIQPILCIGESLEQREAGTTLSVLKEQCQAVILEVGIEAFKHASIAYEPIWAIGTGRTATPEQAQAVHAELRQWLVGLNETVAQELQILYGGSMNAGNADNLLSQTDINGGLIGGASLKANDFLKIYSVAG